MVDGEEILHQLIGGKHPIMEIGVQQSNNAGPSRYKLVHHKSIVILRYHIF